MLQRVLYISAEHPLMHQMLQLDSVINAIRFTLHDRSSVNKGDRFFDSFLNRLS